MEPTGTESSIEWHAYEHQPLERSADWFWALGIMSVASAVTAIILGDILFGILLIIAGISISVLAKREHKIVAFSLHKRGLSINATLYPINHLRAFRIIEDDENGESLLLIDTPRFMTPDLVIPLEEVDIAAVEKWFISHEIPERKELRESLALKFLEFFGF